MKFIVTNQPYSNEYTVTVAPESKRRIVKTAYWTVVGAGTVFLIGTSKPVTDFFKKQPEK